MAASRDGLIAILEDLRRKLQASYPDCASLRRILDGIDVSKWLAPSGEVTREVTARRIV